MHKLAFFILFFISTPTMASTDVHQVHFSGGSMSGGYNGQFKGNFTAPTSFDFSYEIFYRQQMSYYFRITTAMDNPDSRPYYTFAGVGHRFYFNSFGRASEFSDGEISIETRPVWRFFLGADVGTAQVIVKTFGTVLQAVANMLDVGAYAGASYNFSKAFGIELQAGGTYGYGYSSVPANGHTERVFLGVNYMF